MSARGAVRPAECRDLGQWQRMRRALWPKLTDAENTQETAAMLADRERWGVFVSESGGGLVGFVETHLRDYAEGCASSPVGFVEGWYVEPHSRRAGVGRALLVAAEDWARARDCAEMASDAELHNVDGHRAHAALGYAEVERLVAFRKRLA